jgi:hypothetical protein
MSGETLRPMLVVRICRRLVRVAKYGLNGFLGYADDARVAMAKLEKLVIGNLDATTFQSGNEVATLEAETPTAQVQ